jgi:hypothetical protein
LFPLNDGQVDDMTADLIISQLLFLDAEDPKKDIKLFINSPGGSVTAGMPENLFIFWVFIHYGWFRVSSLMFIVVDSLHILYVLELILKVVKEMRCLWRALGMLDMVVILVSDNQTLKHNAWRNLT